MVSVIIELLCHFPWLDRRLMRGVAANNMRTAVSGEICVAWSLMIPLIDQERRKVRTYSLYPHPDGWHVFALQAGAQVLSDHSHKDLGSYPLLSWAIAAAKHHAATEWQQANCECEEISEATNE